MGERVFVDKFFDRSDANRFFTRLNHKGPFAQAFLRTHPQADFRHIAGTSGNFSRLQIATLRRQTKPLRDAVVQRATFNAGRLGALNATRRLLADRRLIEQRIDLMEVRDPFIRLAFGLLSMIHLSPSQLGHFGVCWLFIQIHR